MSSQNVGGQFINWSYKTPLEGWYLSQDLANIIEPGVYAGLHCTRSGPNVIVNATPGESLVGKAVLVDLSDSERRSVCITFTDPNIVISVNNTMRYVVLRYSWSNTENNYAEFVGVDILQPRDIVLCEMTYSTVGALDTVTNTKRLTWKNIADIQKDTFSVTPNRQVLGAYRVLVKGGQIVTLANALTIPDKVLTFPTPSGASVTYWVYVDLTTNSIEFTASNVFGDITKIMLAQVTAQFEPTRVNMYKGIGIKDIIDYRFMNDTRYRTLIFELQNNLSATDSRLAQAQEDILFLQQANSALTDRVKVLEREQQNQQLSIESLDRRVTALGG